MDKRYSDSGVEYSRFIDNDGYITIVKKTSGIAKGVLKGIKADKRMSDDASIVTAVSSCSSEDNYKV